MNMKEKNKEKQKGSQQLKKKQTEVFRRITRSQKHQRETEFLHTPTRKRTKDPDFEENSDDAFQSPTRKYSRVRNQHRSVIEGSRIQGKKKDRTIRSSVQASEKHGQLTRGKNSQEKPRGFQQSPTRSNSIITLNEGSQSHSLGDDYLREPNFTVKKISPSMEERSKKNSRDSSLENPVDRENVDNVTTVNGIPEICRVFSHEINPTMADKFSQSGIRKTREHSDKILATSEGSFTATHVSSREDKYLQDLRINNDEIDNSLQCNSDSRLGIKNQSDGATSTRSRIRTISPILISSSSDSDSSLTTDEFRGLLELPPMKTEPFGIGNKFSDVRRKLQRGPTSSYDRQSRSGSPVIRVDSSTSVESLNTPKGNDYRNERTGRGSVGLGTQNEESELNPRINDLPAEMTSSFGSMHISQATVECEINDTTRNTRKRVMRNYDELSESDESVSESEYNPTSTDDETEEENDGKDEEENDRVTGQSSREPKENNNLRKEDCLSSKKRYRRYVKPVNSKDRIERTRAINAGEAYITCTGNPVRERQRRPLSVCRMKCTERISDETCQNLFDMYYALKNVNAKRIFFAPLIEVIPKKIKKTSVVRPSRQKNRQITLKFSVPINSQLTKVCKGCFKNIFDATNRFINTIAKKKLKKTIGFEVEDERGRHPPPQKMGEEILTRVRDHILSFPAYESHYARQKTSKKYLPSHLNLAVMYNLYEKQYPGEKLSRWSYEREFHNLGLSFKEPKTDTCKMCDQLHMELISAPTALVKEEVSERLASHQKVANAPYDAKESDKSKAKSSHGKMIVGTFDMQQCLPTPSLPTGQIFFSRQLWTYNVTVHNCTTGASINNMWHEGIAPRGANQVASAVYNFILSLPDSVEHVVLYSDCCPGQNKNSIISSMFITVLQQKKTMRIIDHKFLYPGHTRNECDSDHGVIEKAKKKMQYIYLPRDYYTLVRNAGKQFEVVNMTFDKQFDFAAFLNVDGPLKKPTKDVSGEKFKWKPVRWFRYKRSTIGLVQVKSNLGEEEKFQILDFRRRKTVPSLKPKHIPQVPNPINKDKKKDLLKLLPLIDEESRSFYENLITDDQRLIDPDIGMSDDEPEEND